MTTARDHMHTLRVAKDRVRVQRDAVWQIIVKQQRDPSADDLTMEQWEVLGRVLNLIRQVVFLHAEGEDTFTEMQFPGISDDSYAQGLGRLKMFAESAVAISNTISDSLKEFRKTTRGANE